MSLLRRFDLAGFLLISGGCFGPTVIDAPAPDPDTRAVLITRLDLQTNGLEAVLLEIETYRDPGRLLAMLSRSVPSRVWIELLRSSPSELGLAPGPMVLASEPRCGVRPVAPGYAAFVLHPGEEAFVEDPGSPRPALLHQGECGCLAPVVEPVPIEDLCRVRPAPGADGDVILSLARQIECGLNPPRIFGLATLDPDSLEISATTTLAYNLSAPLPAADGSLYWGARRVVLSSTAGIARTDLELELTLVAGAPGLGALKALAWEEADKTILFLSNSEQTEPRVPSRLFRVELASRAITELVLPAPENPNESQSDVLLRYAERDVLVFPAFSHRWFRVRDGQLLVDPPAFADMGRVLAGTVDPLLGPLITSRSGTLLRFDGVEFLPLPFEIEGGPQRLQAPFSWRGSVGFLTTDGRVEQYRADEPHCPTVDIDPFLQDPIALVVGDRVVVSGIDRATSLAKLFLLDAPQ